MVKKHSWYPEYLRATGERSFHPVQFLRSFLFMHGFRYLFYLRIAQSTKSKLVKLFCECCMFRMCRKFGIEIKSATSIGKGFQMVHPYNITIHPESVLGSNVTMLKGSTVGIGWGKKQGCPRIGSRVFIGLNATVIGGITVGDDVLIAPNTFVNQDIPSHCIVIGNPCQVIPKENASRNYMWNMFYESQ